MDENDGKRMTAIPSGAKQAMEEERNCFDLDVVFKGRLTSSCSRIMNENHSINEWWKGEAAVRRRKNTHSKSRCIIEYHSVALIMQQLMSSSGLE